MRPVNCISIAEHCQKNMYLKLNDFSDSHQILGRLLSIPVALLDVALDTFKTPLAAIEGVALTVINLFGALFSNNYNLKDALFSAEFALCSAASIPVKVVMAPLKFVFQLFAGLISPNHVKSIYEIKTFTSDYYRGASVIVNSSSYNGGQQPYSAGQTYSATVVPHIYTGQTHVYNG